MEKQVIKCISLTKEHGEFLNRQRGTFCFSKFVREKLEEYKKFIDGLEVKNEKAVE